MDIPILFEDGEALVIDKPAGLPIERPRRGGPSLEDHLDALKLGFQRAPVPVHRIDTDTSGCLLLARNPKALKRFAKAFEERRVGKRYLGIVDGVPQPEEGEIALALAKISSAEKRLAHDPGEEGQGVTDPLALAAKSWSAARCWNSNRKPDARTRSASMSRAGSACRCWATRSMAMPPPVRAPCSMPQD